MDYKNQFLIDTNNEVKCIDNEIPFDIPKNWIWIRLENICGYIQRGKQPEYSKMKKYPVISQKCIQWDGFSIDKARFIKEDSIKKYNSERILQDNDLLWNSTGLGTLGRIAIYEEKKNKYNWAVADSHVTVIRPLKKFINSKYCLCYFSSSAVQNIIEYLAGGSTKQKELSLKTIKKYLFPVPPINEQKRIVEKLEQIPQTEQ